MRRFYGIRISQLRSRPLSGVLPRRESYQWSQNRSLSRTICFYSTVADASDEKLRYPESKSSKHHDLQSYLEYASRVGLDPQSTTYIGTHYEYTVKESLKRLGFELRQVGGTSDYGIDLIGNWNLPSAPKPLKVLVQCKALAKKVSPSVVRELEGAFVGAPAGWRGSAVLGILVIQNPATKGVRDALGRSRWPMGFVTCTAEGKLLQMLWNKRAEEEGIQGIGVGLKYSGGAPDKKEIHLTWKGEGIPDQI